MVDSKHPLLDSTRVALLRTSSQREATIPSVSSDKKPTIEKASCKDHSKKNSMISSPLLKVVHVKNFTWILGHLRTNSQREVTLPSVSSVR